MPDSLAETGQDREPSDPPCRLATRLTELPGTNRQRFLDACRCRTVDRPPFWLMRQAGRALPEYRQLKQRHSFLELVRTPDLAAEITLQPIRRFQYDAAILFSDILVIAEALGQPYGFRDTGGIEMAFAIRSTAEIDRLEVSAVRERLAYMAEALRLSPQEPSLHYLHGLMLADGGAAPRAIAEFREAVRLGPTTPLAERARQRIAALGGR